MIIFVNREVNIRNVVNMNYYRDKVFGKFRFSSIF